MIFFEIMWDVDTVLPTDPPPPKLISLLSAKLDN